MRRIARALARLAVAGQVAVIVLAFVPVWPCTLLVHFRVQLAIGSLAVVAAAWWIAPRGWFDAAALALLVDLLVVAPDLQRTRRPLPAGTAVKLVFANVLTTNRDFDRLAALVDAEQPDIVGLVEVDRTWLERLAPALAGYARIAEVRDDNFGVALFVRGTLAGGSELLGSELPTIVAEAALAAGPRISIVLAHPMPPISGRAEAIQDRQLAAVARRARALTGPVVVAGDLNATPWSSTFLRFAGALGGCDSRAGFGYQGSFPAASAILRIPIDHVLVSCDVGVRDRRIGPPIGSDHLPVIVELVVPSR